MKKIYSTIIALTTAFTIGCSSSQTSLERSLADANRNLRNYSQNPSCLINKPKFSFETYNVAGYDSALQIQYKDGRSIELHKISRSGKPANVSDILIREEPNGEGKGYTFIHIYEYEFELADIIWDNALKVSQTAGKKN